MTVKLIPGDAHRRLEAAIQALENKVAKVGWFEKSRYPDEKTANGKSISGLPVAYVAAIQEYGYPEKNIPARPMVRPTVHQQKNVWTNKMRIGIQAVINGNNTIDDVLESIGLKAAGDIRKMIASITTPALSPVTVQRRLEKRGVKTAGEIAKKWHKGTPLNKTESRSLGKLDKPLIDTKLMYLSVTNTVDNK